MEPAPLFELEEVFGNLIAVLLSLGAILLFIVLIFGGFKYLTSGGDPKNIGVAKNTLTYAIGGFILLALSYIILLIIENVTGANITDFSIFVG